MSEKTCPHCGRAVREGDKFCIFCGKPLLTDFSKTVKEATDKKGSIIFPTQEPPTEEEEKEEATPFESGDLAPPDNGKSKKKKKDKDDIPFDVGEEEEELLEALEMEDEMREQFEMKMELAVLYGKKERLKEKLDKLLKDAKSERYELDIDFAKEVNMRLEAVKEVQRELRAPGQFHDMESLLSGTLQVVVRQGHPACQHQVRGSGDLSERTQKDPHRPWHHEEAGQREP